MDRRTFLSHSVRYAGAAGALATVGSAGLASLVDLSSAVPIALSAPPIITRAQWGADESRRRELPLYHPVRKFVIHHTATPNGGDPVARVRSIYGSHLNRDDGGQWIDIGYNFLVDEHGNIFEGRYARNYAPGEIHDGEDAYFRGARGAHAGEWNGGSVGIAMLGTYSGARPTEATINAIADLIAWKSNRHGLDPGGVEPWTASDGRTRVLPTIVGHRDVRSTGCPGNGGYSILSEIRRRAAARMAGVEPVPMSNGQGGYRIIHSTGDITRFGGIADIAGLPALGVAATVTAATPVPGRAAFWMVDEAGEVYRFGGAPDHGSLPALRRAGTSIGQSNVVRMAARSDGGYWVVDRNGGVFAFRDAPFFGSVPGLRASGLSIGEAEIVTLEPTLDGNGYYVLDRNGGVFALGAARFQGSLPALLAQGSIEGPIDVTDLRVAPNGGYWVLDRRGGVFAFGGAPFHGSVPATGFLGARAVRLVPTADGGGYLILSEDGAVIPFGNAVFHGHGPHLHAVDLVVSS